MNEGIMKYRGYSARIEYSPEDECLVGRVIGINDSISFHGDSVKDMRRELKVSIDEYLKACEKFGKIPEQPKSGKLSLRLPAELHAAVAQQSEITGRSVNQMVIDALEATYFGQTEKSVPRRNAGRKTASSAFGHE